jgi:hypothetical protein
MPPLTPEPMILPHRTRSRWNAATVSWVVVGLIAASYLIVVALRPAFIAQYLPERAPSEPQSNEGQRAMSKALAEVESLRESLGQLQLELAKVKTEVATFGDRAQRHEAQLKDLENKTVALNGLVERASTGLATSPDTASSKLSTSNDTAPKTVVASTAQVPPQKTAPAPTKPLETGTITPAKPPAAPAAQPITFGPATVKPAPAQYAIEIAEGTSMDALRLSWSLMSDKHAATLGKLEPRFLPGSVSADGQNYALIAGPIKSAAEASKICKALEAKSNPCRVSVFEGDPL